MENEQLNIELEEQPPQHGKRVYVYFAVLILAVLTAFGMKSQWQKHVPVRQVSVEGVSVISKDEIVRLMKLPPNVPMYELDLTSLQKNILTNSFVEKVVIQRDAPASLRVKVEERKPAAILLSGELYYIASDGTVLPYIASSETYDIPVISGMDSTSAVKTGQKLFNPDVREALEIVAASKSASDELFHAVSEIRLRKGHDLVLYSFESGIPIIFGKGDAVKKMVKLDAFWQKFVRNNETKDIQYIDIRFDDQVVVSRKTS
ncbi:MAG: cell division protein FtsQ/DivIB [Bacteroidota bacterium]